MSGMQIAASTPATDRALIRSLPIVQTAIDSATTNNGLNPYANTIIYQFPYQQNFNQSEMALYNWTLNFSWFNIQASFGNNTFSYVWPIGAGFQTFTVTVPDGFYLVSTLNAYLQQQMLLNGTWYESGTSGVGPTATTPIYLISFAENIIYYRVTLTVLPVLTTADRTSAGYVLPSNYPGAEPSADTFPQLVVPTTNQPAGSNTPSLYSFSKYLGFSPGSYPPTTAATATQLYNANGQFPPFVESTSTVILSCDLILANGVSSSAGFLYSFATSGFNFGQSISIEPKTPLWFQVADQSTSYLRFVIRDENFVPLNIQDPHVTMLVCIRGR